MAVVPTAVSSGSGLNAGDVPVMSSVPASSLTSLAAPASSANVNVPANEYVKNKDTYFGLTPFSGETGSGLVDLNKMFDELTGKMGKVAMEQMSGVIPEDVQKQLRIMRAESSLGYGLGAGSQASRNIEARDLGLTSLDIQQKGVANAQAVAQLAESKREYNKTYELNMTQFMQDVRGKDLAATELMESSRQFDVKMKLAAQELAANVLSGYHSLMSAYATPDKAGSYVSSLTSDMNSILAKIKPLT
jgi:hypothetical protein